MLPEQRQGVPVQSGPYPFVGPSGLSQHCEGALRRASRLGVIGHENLARVGEEEFLKSQIEGADLWMKEQRVAPIIDLHIVASPQGAKAVAPQTQLADEFLYGRVVIPLHDDRTEERHGFRRHGLPVPIEPPHVGFEESGPHRVRADPEVPAQRGGKGFDASTVKLPPWR